MDQDIQEKLNKVLELQKRAATEGEAEAAARALTRLLTRHNLSEADIRDIGPMLERFVFMNGDDAWEQYLIQFMSPIFFCRGFKYGREGHSLVVGEKKHILETIKVFHQIRESIRRLASTRWSSLDQWERASVKRKAWKRHYSMGAALGVIEAMKAERDAVVDESQAWGLVIIRDAAVDDFVNKVVGPKTEKSRVKDTDAFRWGLFDGQHNLPTYMKAEVGETSQT